MNTKEKGELVQAIILAELIKAGMAVLLPFGDNQRYDMVIDCGDNFLRVQCKHGRLRDGCIKFNARSTVYGGGYRSYKGQVDLFAVYCSDNQRSYLIPVDEVCNSEVYLRVEQTKNGQASGIKWAKDYELNGP